MPNESPSPSDAVLVCDGLVRRFGGRVAVDHVSFRIAPGETYGLLGPNGAGKTTTISMLSGILAADAGTVTLGGQPISTSSSPGKHLLGLVPQNIALFDDLSARENLRFFGGLHGLRGKHLDRRIDATLELVGLADRADDRIDTYSGGMQRRANIAVGLLHEPHLLVLDEPTVGVDPQSRNQILESVERLSAEGLAVLYTTHYMEEAERLCDRVGIIDSGRLVAEGTRRELVARIGQHDRVTLRGDGDLHGFARRVAQMPGIVTAEVVDSEAAAPVVHLTTDDAGPAIATIVATAAGDGIAITGIEVHEPNLEAVFLHLTGRALRDRAE